MKKIIVLIFLTAIFSARAETFNLMPLKIHYLGAVGAGDNIIAYGTNGAYLLSTDKGQSWTQRNLNNFGQINHIINFKDTLWGIVNNGCIISSTDYGLHWNEYQIPIDSADRLHKIAVNDNNLYIRSLKHILRIDRNMNLINTLTDTIIYNNYYRNSWFEPDYPEHYFDYYFQFFNGDLLAGISSQIAGFLAIDEDINNYELITLKDKIHTGKPVTYEINQTIEIGGEKVINIGYQFYKIDDNYQNFEYFFLDTLYMNRNDSNYRKKDYVSPGSFFTIKNDLYSTDIEARDNYYGYYNFCLKKYSSSPVDTFTQCNNYFNNNYSTMAYSTSVADFDGIGLTYGINGVPYHTNSLVLTCGMTKKLILTSDLGKSWNLVSYLTGTPVAIINDSSYIFHNDKKYTNFPGQNNFNEICRSNDFGLTFLPMYQCEDCSYTIRGITHPTVMYFDTNGNGFYTGTKESSTDTNNMAVFSEGYSKYDMLTLENLHNGHSTQIYKGSNVIDLDGHYMFSTADNLDWSFNFIYFTDKNFENFRFITCDSLFYVHHILAEKFEHFLMFCSVKEDRDHNFTSFEVYETNDSGKTKSSICKIDDSLAVNQIYELNKDSVFFAATYPARILMYDRKRNTFDNLYENAELDSIFFMELSGKFYILGEELFLENTDRNDLTKWEDAPWDYGRPTFTSVICKGNVALVGLSDSLRPFNYYRMMTEEHAPVGVEIQAEKLYYTNHFYAGNPYPLPGRNLIKTYVTYDKSFDLEESIMGVYDLSGEQVQNKEHIEINWLNKASAEFIWNCSAVPSGIYFILVRHNGITDSIPIVVEK